MKKIFPATLLPRAGTRLTTALMVFSSLELEELEELELS
jgi:hypothetical protein